MTERLRDQIAQLRAITPKLHEVTDDAARIVQRVETFLTEECKLGLTAHFSFDHEPDYRDGSDRWTQLEYGRINDQYRLIVSEIDIDQSGTEYCTSRAPWVNCSRELKLRAVAQIPGLLIAIGQKVNSTIKQAQESTVTVNEILHDLGIAEKGGK